MSEAKKKETLEWLDKQIAWREEGKKLARLEDVAVCDVTQVEEDEIQVRGITFLAEMLGKRMLYQQFEKGGILYFVYKGYKIYEYKKGWT